MKLGDLMYQVNTTRKKGRSLVRPIDTYVVVDIETTGLSPESDDVIEIGAIKVINNEIVDEFSKLIRIERPLSPFITNLTGITDDMLAGGEDPDVVLRAFDEFLGDHIIIGHNVNFDINFLYDKFERYLEKPLCNDFLDTMRIARRQVKDLKNYKLGTLAEHFQIDYRGAHRGLTDVMITYHVYNQMRSM